MVAAVRTYLTAIGDVWLCVKRRELADAKEMGRKFAEDFRLLEDLGWPEAIVVSPVRVRVSPSRPAHDRRPGALVR